MTTAPAPGETPPNPAADGETPPAVKTAAELQADLDKAQKALKEANRESADRRKRLEALEKAEADRTSAELTETQKLKADLDKATSAQAEILAKANARVLRAEVLARASATFIDPDVVLLLVKDKLTVSDEGEVEGLDEALKDLAKAKPHMVKQRGAGSQNAGNPAGGGDGGGETDPQRRARVYGSGGSVFDASAAREHGGGVILPNEK